MTTCDRECEACPREDVCEMQAAYDWRAELAAEREAESESVPRILSCDQHADLERRVAVLEDILSRVVRELNMGREP